MTETDAQRAGKSPAGPLMAVLVAIIIAAAAYGVWAVYHGERLKQQQAAAEVQQALIEISELRTQIALISKKIKADDERLGSLETARARGSVREASIIMAVLALQNSIDREGPFSENLELLQTLMPGNRSLQQLKPYSTEGVSSLISLKYEFAAISNRLDNEARIADNRQPAGRVRALLRSMVVVRKVDGSAVGNTLVSRAERALDAGNLKAAIALVQQLEGKPLQTAEPWLEKANARLNVDSVMAALTLNAAAAVSQGR
ncbi:MAG: mitofilin family membrane protein [Alphaproteobacteria bacterium]|nr:mitofilin family membrane protein [Alphaproteobacteria bacterium]